MLAQRLWGRDVAHNPFGETLKISTAIKDGCYMCPNSAVGGT